jgi:hypothetical protein
MEVVLERNGKKKKKKVALCKVEADEGGKREVKEGFVEGNPGYKKWKVSNRSGRG